LGDDLFSHMAGMIGWARCRIITPNAGIVDTVALKHFANTFDGVGLSVRP